MSSRLVLSLLAACSFAVVATGCHQHLSYHDRVWNGWCGSHVGCETDCGKGKGGKSSTCIHCGGVLRKAGSYFFCANGCGEHYVGEWISDPPDCCDPCDAYYGCFTGAGDCCDKKTFDPLLRILRWKHKHCAPWYANENIPSSGCHYVECPYVYGCHPQICATGCGGKGCGGKCGKGVVGDYVPADIVEPLPQQSDDFSIPTPTLAGAENNRVAAYVEDVEETHEQ